MQRASIAGAALHAFDRWTDTVQDGTSIAEHQRRRRLACRGLVSLRIDGQHDRLLSGTLPLSISDRASDDACGTDGSEVAAELFSP